MVHLQQLILFVMWALNIECDVTATFTQTFFMSDSEEEPLWQKNIKNNSEAIDTMALIGVVDLSLFQ